MGEEWDSNKGGRDQWINWLCEIMQEAKRVLKPGGHGFVWALPRTSHWTAFALENAGFEIRDVIQHVFGNGFPKSQNISIAIDKKACREQFESEHGRTPTPDEFKIAWDGFREVVGNYEHWGRQNRTYNTNIAMPCQDDRIRDFQNLTTPLTPEAQKWEGFGTGLKPAIEEWILCRKAISEKTIAENVLRWGTGGLNIDACRVPANSGRFPSHLIWDGSDEVKAEFDKAGYSVSSGIHKYPKVYNSGGKNTKRLLGNFKRIYDWHSVSDSGSAARFFYCAKPSKAERDAGLEEMSDKYLATMNDGIGVREHNPEQKTAWVKNNHPTVKSIKLMQYLIKLITPPGGTVLDPFMGSGSTGVGAVTLGFGFIGCEKEPDYYAIAERRIEYWKSHRDELEKCMNEEEITYEDVLKISKQKTDSNQINLF
jgi:DNA modification methylase